MGGEGGKIKGDGIWEERRVGDTSRVEHAWVMFGPGNCVEGHQRRFQHVLSIASSTAINVTSKAQSRNC